jgi:hypothetical protein
MELEEEELCAHCASDCTQYVCSNCFAVEYCDAECQRNDWAEHQKICFDVLYPDLEHLSNMLKQPEIIIASNIDQAVIQAQELIGKKSKSKKPKTKKDQKRKGDRLQKKAYKAYGKGTKSIPKKLYYKARRSLV